MSIGIDIGKYSVKIVELASTNNQVTVKKIGSLNTFSDINKWSPADIWAVKGGVTFDFNQFSTLGEFTNELKQLYDSQDLVGISLKKAAG